MRRRSLADSAAAAADARAATALHPDDFSAGGKLGADTPRTHASAAAASAAGQQLERHESAGGATVFTEGSADDDGAPGLEAGPQAADAAQLATREDAVAEAAEAGSAMMHEDGKQGDAAAALEGEAEAEGEGGAGDDAIADDGVDGEVDAATVEAEAKAAAAADVEGGEAPAEEVVEQ